MTPNKTNFKATHSDMTCRFCLIRGSEENLEHFCSCIYLIEVIPEILTVDPDDIYGDIDDQIKATHIWMKVFKQLDSIQQNQAHSLTVPHVRV